MRINVSLGQYVPGPSPLHAMDPRAKVLCAVVLMVLMFTVSTPAQAILAAAMVCVLCLAGAQTPWSVLRSVLPVVLGLALVAALNLFVTQTGAPLVELGPLRVTTGGLATAALFALRLTLLVMCGAVLLSTTTPTQLTQAFSGLLAPLKRLGAPVDQLALVLSLALRFVPLLSDEAESVMNAQAARGAQFDRGGFVGRVKALPALLVPIFAGALRHAQDLSRALEARGYDADATRTQWKKPHLTATDLGYAVLTVLYGLGLAWLGR